MTAALSSMHLKQTQDGNGYAKTRITDQRRAEGGDYLRLTRTTRNHWAQARVHCNESVFFRLDESSLTALDLDGALRPLGVAGALLLDGGRGRDVTGFKVGGCVVRVGQVALGLLVRRSGRGRDPA